MKIKKAILLAVVVTGCFFAQAAAANAPAGVTLAVVDTNRVLQDTNAAKSMFAELEKKRAEYQAQISKEENELRATEKDLVEKKDKLGKDEFEKKRTAFEKSIAEGQKRVQDKKRTLDKAHAESIAKLKTEVAKVVSEIAKEKGASVVLTQESVMLVAPELNITDEVIKRLNASVKKIAVDWASAQK